MRRTAMTLIEMMVALAIVSMLTVTALAVASSLSRGQDVDRRRLRASALEVNLQAVLSADLAHASHYRNTGKGFALRMRAALDADTLELRHLPATTTYEIRIIEGRRWLARRQESPDKTVLVEWVCTGAEAIRFGSGGSNEQPGEKDWSLVPGTATVTVDFKDGNRPPARFRCRTR